MAPPHGGPADFEKSQKYKEMSVYVLRIFKIFQIILIAPRPPAADEGCRLVGCGCVRCFSVRMTVPILPTVSTLPTVPMSFFIFPIEMKAENINEEHARILQNLWKIY